MDISFSQGINIFIGPNGAGKTNLLDAIYTLALTKSSLNASDSALITHEQKYYSLLGTLHKSDKKLSIQIDYIKGKKNLKVNNEPIAKLSQYIGSFPIVLFTPYDTDLIREGSEIRRKFIDGIISQKDSDYLNHLIQYNQILKQRNALLKQINQQQLKDNTLIEIYNERLIPLSEKIFYKRKVFLNHFEEKFNTHYQSISQNKENCKLIYQSQHIRHPQFETYFTSQFERDKILQRTNVGIHKDDIDFILNNHPIKNYGSQGQQKSFVSALKLAQFDELMDQNNEKPVLLMDDIFDKLDDKRISQLMSKISSGTFGQIFITDARPERTQKILKDHKLTYKLFHVEKGKITQTS